jgi:hypothetical protein
MSSNDIWKQFVIFWTTPVESESEDEYPKTTYPTNLVGVCELGYDECSQFKNPKFAMIYIIEDYRHLTHLDDDIRQYCEKCYFHLIDELSAYHEDSIEEQVHQEKKEFTKFFRNWHFGLIDNAQIGDYNETRWTDEELLEIFSILQLYVQMDDVAAGKLDDHMAGWKQLAEEVSDYL